MTSPGINKSPEKQKAENKSPSHSDKTVEKTRAGDATASTTTGAQQADPFSWLRVFKLADLMMKQGC